MLLGLHHVAICTPDADRLIGFYRDRLGFAVAVDQSWEPGVDLADTVLGLEGTAGRQVLLKIGNAYLELFEFRSPAGRAADPDRRVCDHGYTHLCVDVDDLDSTYERLLSADVPLRRRHRICFRAYGRATAAIRTATWWKSSSFRRGIRSQQLAPPSTTITVPVT